MVWLEQPLPPGSLDAEIVLHVRSVVRRRVRRGDASMDDISLYFGMSPDERTATLAPGSRLSIDDVAHRLGALRGVQILELPTDGAFVTGCVVWLRARKRQDNVFDRVVATDPATLLALSRARELAIAEAPPHVGAEPSPIPILLHGETGTGKELLARAIHALWAKGRPAAPFVAVQVAGMTPPLINDELFGHVKGAFTDAREERKGQLEQADGGTLLIDEVGDLPIEAQLRLLRFLQDQLFARTGSDKAPRRLKVRLLSATWHNLDDDVESGTFRRDLLPRLGAEVLVLPPLHQRHGFFGEGLDELLSGLGAEGTPLLTRSARDALSGHPWPGNLRELTTVLRSALASAHGATVRLEDLPEHIQRHYLARPLEVLAPGTLEDVADAKELPAEVLQGRVGSLARIVDSSPLPPERTPLGAVRDLLVGIPDPSSEHQATVASLRQHIERVRQADHARMAEHFWQQVLNNVHEARVRTLVQECLATAAARSAELNERAERASEQLGLERSPWIRVATDLQRLPLLSEVPPQDLFNAIAFVLKALYSAVPEVAEDVRAVAKSGGLPALRAKLRELAEADETVETGGLPETPPSLWDRQDWENLARQVPSKSQAAQRLNVDVRTVTRYLDALGVRWSRDGIVSASKKIPPRHGRQRRRR